MSIETLAFTFLFLPPNRHPRTRSDQEGGGRGIVRPLARRSHYKEPDVPQGANRDSATGGPGGKLLADLGRSSQHPGEKREKLVFGSHRVTSD